MHRCHRKTHNTCQHTPHTTHITYTGRIHIDTMYCSKTHAMCSYHTQCDWHMSYRILYISRQDRHILYVLVHSQKYKHCMAYTISHAYTGNHIYASHCVYTCISFRTHIYKSYAHAICTHIYIMPYEHMSCPQNTTYHCTLTACAHTLHLLIHHVPLINRM